MPLPLEGTRILVTNDDGIDAPGLAALERIATRLSNDVWVVAPTREQSGAGHSLTLHSPLRSHMKGKQRFAVDGTPTDCVLLGVKELLKDQRPGLVLSGVNAGSNLGEDVTYSGTVAAAMEGTLLDIPSIAVSQTYIGEKSTMIWDTAEYYLPELIIHLMAVGIPTNTMININIPSLAPDEVKGVKVAPQGKRKPGDNISRRIDPDGRPYYWIGGVRNEDKEHAASDLAAIRNGYITITPLCLDLTHYSMLESLDSLFTRHFSSLEENAWKRANQ